MSTKTGLQFLLVCMSMLGFLPWGFAVYKTWNMMAPLIGTWIPHLSFTGAIALRALVFACAPWRLNTQKDERTATEQAVSAVVIALVMPFVVLGLNGFVWLLIK